MTSSHVKVRGDSAREVTARSRNSTFRPRTLLPEHYVKEIRPPSPKGKPITVDFSIHIVDINSINVEDMDFRVDMFVRQQWVEPRLTMPASIFEEGDDYVTLPPQFFDNLWQPDPYFINSKVVEIATLTHKFSSVTLYRNKTVLYSARMHAIVACQMEFRFYPMDIQECPIYIESFSYDSQKVRLRWSEAGVTVNPELKLLQYHFGQPLELEEIHTYMAEKGGNFSRLAMYFRFERQIGHHLIQTFAPSALVVVLSWFSFWLGLDAIPGRVTLLVTCMLTLVTMFTGLKSDIPPVAYVKALDLWMAGCMLFVFAALGEFVVVKVIDNKYQAAKCEGVGNETLGGGATSPVVVPVNLGPHPHTAHPGGKTGVGGGTGTDAHWAKMGSGVGKRPPQYASVQAARESAPGLFQLAWTNTSTGEEKVLWQEIDRMSCTVFPALFLLFIVIFWPILLLRKT